MASEDWAKTHPLIVQDLAQRPFELDFYQAVRRLESLYRDKPRVGYSLTPADDAVRFGQEPTLAFPPAAIAACRPASGGGEIQLAVYFMGLLGPNGPLPIHMTEQVLIRVGDTDQPKDPVLIHFLDIFHHRLIALFYRAWAQSQIAVSFDRPQDDPFVGFLGSLIGIGMPSFRNRDDWPDHAKLHFSGHLLCRTKCPDALSAIVGAYFGIRVAIQEFIGRWIDLPPENLCQLGQSPASGLLGQTAIVGSRFWDCQQTFLIRLGAMGFADYQRFLPGRKSLSRLVACVRNCMGDQWAWQVQLVLRAEEVPQISLGRQGQLGWTTWLQSKPFTRDADELVMEPQAA